VTDPVLGNGGVELGGTASDTDEGNCFDGQEDKDSGGCLDEVHVGLGSVQSICGEHAKVHGSISISSVTSGGNWILAGLGGTDRSTGVSGLGGGA
jgi:hypothetical protein